MEALSSKYKKIILISQIISKKILDYTNICFMIKHSIRFYVLLFGESWNFLSAQIFCHKGYMKTSLALHIRTLNGGENYFYFCNYDHIRWCIQTRCPAMIHQNVAYWPLKRHLGRLNLQTEESKVGKSVNVVGLQHILGPVANIKIESQFRKSNT